MWFSLPPSQLAGQVMSAWVASHIWVTAGEDPSSQAEGDLMDEPRSWAYADDVSDCCAVSPCPPGPPKHGPPITCQETETLRVKTRR